MNNNNNNNNNIEKSNLEIYIIDKLDGLLGHRLLDNIYFDIYSETELTTNNNSIDIISFQLKLVFENNNSIFISWATIENWDQYSLCISEKSFAGGIERYTKKDKNWASIIGQKLVSYEVYGYEENTITETETISGKSITTIFVNEPHMVVLKFANDTLLGIANFYMSDDFKPTLAMGDDVWIIFDSENINSCVTSLNLVKIEVKNSN